MELAKAAYELDNSNYKALNYAKALILTNDFDLAKSILLNITKSKYISAELKMECLKSLAIIYRSINDIDKASKIYEEIVVINPADTQAWVDYAILYFNFDSSRSIDILNRQRVYLLERIKEINQTQPYILTQPNQTPFEQWYEGQNQPIKIPNPACERIQNYIDTVLDPNIAKSYLHIFRDPLLEAWQAIAIFERLEEQNSTNSSFWYYYAKALEYVSLYDRACQAYE